jgi:SAM-dependent methyltransferase
MANQQIQEYDEICERVDHQIQNDLYYAHLSIYNFAREYCQGGVVMDAGSGSGYGAAFLADHGAEFVWGCEIDESAVELSKSHFQRANLAFRVMDLQNIAGFPPHYFDLIISSNVLEHLPYVTAFFHAASRLLKPGGTLIVAVPPITREVDWHENIANIYHLNIWTPLQWAHVVNQYMLDVQTYWHGLGRSDVAIDFSNIPETTVINEKDFLFRAVPVDELYKNTSLTAVFLAQSPRAQTDIPDLDTRLTFVDSSFSRVPIPSQEPPGVSTATADTEKRTLNQGRSSGYLNRFLNVILDVIRKNWQTVRRQDHPPAPRKYQIIAGPPSPEFMYGTNVTTYTNLGPMFQGQIYYQRFVSRENGLSGISLMVATYRKQINSSAKLCILNGAKQQTIREVEQDTRSYIDNSWQRFDFEPILDSKDKEFWFSIETDAQEGEAITLWTNNTILGICQKEDQDLYEVMCFQCHFDDSSQRSEKT